MTIYAARLAGPYRNRNPFPRYRSQRRRRSIFDDPFFEGPRPERREAWPDLTIPWLKGVKGIEAVDYNNYLNGLLSTSSEGGEGFTINGLTVEVPSRFSLFPRQRTATFRLPRREVRRKGPDGIERDYFAYTLEPRFRAKEYGEYRFGPVVAKGYILYETKDAYEPRKVYTVSNPIVLRVVPPPEEGRPVSFSGAIGRFTVSAKASPVNVHVGDPIMLELLVKGTGELTRIGPVKLSAQKAFEKFKVYDEPTAGEKDGGKVFVYRIRAKEESLTEIPPIEFSYFDPEKEKYVTVRTDPIPITVKAGKVLSPEKIVQATETAPKGQKLEETGRGIRADYDDLDALEPQTPFRVSTVHLAVFLGLPPFLFSLLAGFLAWRRSALSDPARRRARGAAPRARAPSAGPPPGTGLVLHGFC